MSRIWSLDAIFFAGKLLLSACGVLILFAFVQHRVRQLPLRRIPGPTSTSFFTGSRKQMFHVAASKFHEYIHKTYGNVVRITGFLGETHLVISDANACTSIFLKEQDVFEETPWFTETHRHFFGPGLFATMGAHHRKQRKALNPVFSTKHMRTMVPLFQTITRQLRDILSSKVGNASQELDILEWFGRLALELVAQGGLGYTFKSLSPDGEHENEFSRAIKEYIPTMGNVVLWRPLFPLVSSIIPPRILRLAATCLPFPSLHNLVRISDALHNNAKAVFNEKKALLEKGDAAFVDQVGEGKDVITVLLRESRNASEENRMPDEEIVAQMAMLLFAATDSTSTALSRTLHVLSKHPEAQEKLREELKATEGEIGYDELVALPYLDAICRETLRLYPPVNFVQRTCRADTTIPLSQPIATPSGPLYSLYVPRNTTIYVSILAINRDPNIWGPDAAEWKPERWLSPLPDSVAEARIPGVYSNTLTFIGGGRACIGFKFSQLEMKVVLAELIPHFRFSLAKQEIIWRFGGLVTPSVKGETAVGPKMPITIQRV